jgi:hypothetical protein
MKPDELMAFKNRRRVTACILFMAVVLAVLAIKSFNEGWFEPKTPLVLDDQPALVFFTLEHGCECQMLVIRNAEAQLTQWPVVLEQRLPIFRVDFSRRPDLARQYGVRRAPALVFLDEQGQVKWKQDVGLSDELPFDLATAGYYIQDYLDIP